MASDYRSGYDGKDFNFDGAGDYIDLGVIDYLSSGFDENSEYSIECWVNFDDVTTTQWFVATTNSSSNNGINMWIQSNAIRFGNSSPTANVASIIYNTTTTLATGNWYHIVGTKDSSGFTTSAFKLYINGSQESTGITLNNYAGTMVSDGLLWLGKRRFSGNQPTNFKLSNFRLYDRTLSSSEVLQNYNTTKGSYLVDSIITDGLVGYWNSREQFGGVNNTETTWYDRVGINDGTSNGVLDSNGNLTFNGSQYVNIETTSNIPLNFPLTLAAWIKPNWDGVQTDTIISIGSGTSTQFAIDSSWNAKTLRGRMPGVGLNGITELVNGRWYYTTFTINSNGDLRLYLNGEYENGLDNQTTPASVTATMEFARQPQASTYYHNGSITNIQIYNRALTPEEVRHNYNQTLIDFL
jgi:hypothetical protein